ncbi:hypothetical protein AB0E01_02045 [Nocardia vinacea]|uniref:GNAT family N-acetyltransferase n=1 Tax=Nocardia vinacea TaxID=96468 RepID=UPI0033DA688A
MGASDAPAVFEAFTDPAIQRWHRRTATSIEEVGEWIGSWQQHWSSGVYVQWAVADAHTR